VAEHIIGFVHVILPRYSEAGQRKAMVMHSIERVVQHGGKLGNVTLRELANLARPEQPGTVIAVQHALLLADPKAKRKRGGTRASFWSTFDAIEARGGVIWELYTGLRTDKPPERDRMTREAIDALARGRHKTSVADKRGRPRKRFGEAELAKARALWESRKLKTWADVQAKLPKGITTRDCWNLWGRRNSED